MQTSSLMKTTVVNKVQLDDCRTVLVLDKYDWNFDFAVLIMGLNGYYTGYSDISSRLIYTISIMQDNAG